MLRPFGTRMAARLAGALSTMRRAACPHEDLQRACANALLEALRLIESQIAVLATQVWLPKRYKAGERHKRRDRKQSDAMVRQFRHEAANLLTTWNKCSPPESWGLALVKRADAKRPASQWLARSAVNP